MADGQVEKDVLTWPPRAPDLIPLDFYLLRRLKPLAYSAPVTTEEAHHLRMDACQTICSYPGIFERMRQSVIRHVEAALNIMEEILSTYYKCTHSDITHKLNVAGHMLIRTFFSCFCMRNSCSKFVRNFHLHLLCMYVYYIYIFLLFFFYF
jgi:hypothetical protein